MKNLLIAFILLMSLSACKKKTTGTQKALIIYHTSGCYGYCPVYHLQVNNDKTARLYAEVVYKNGTSELDSSKMGYFTGTLQDTLFNNLKDKLNRLDLDNLTFDGADCCDAPIVTIIIYYDGKRKFLRSMFPPAISGPLLSALDEICISNNFTRTSEPFRIEGQE